VPDAFFKENKIRLVWTDPPYGVSYADKNQALNQSDRGNRVQKAIVNDHMTADATEALFVGALVGCVRPLRAWCGDSMPLCPAGRCTGGLCVASRPPAFRIGRPGLD
jgi:hypothetical protein